MKLRVEPTDCVIGAVVHGIDLNLVPKGDLLEQMENALETYGLLIFPDQQHITPQQQIDFSLAFGPLEVTDMETALMPGYPEIFVVGNTGKAPVTFSPADDSGELEWHTDHIHLAVPARASLLLAKAVPPVGGDTLFACMYSAYETLAPEQQHEYDSLEVVNDVSGLAAYLDGQGLDMDARDDDLKSPVIWPLVRAHPRSGRKALYFGNQVSVDVVGWPRPKTKAFIAELTTHACQPAFQYCHKWRVGDAVLWDNRRVLHAGTSYNLNGPAREMHRTTIRETVVSSSSG